jgi:hypothetical protein
MNYNIEIGEKYELDNSTTISKIVPKYTIRITEEQKLVLDTFANVEIDSDLNKIYVINNIRFKIVPYLEKDNSHENKI